MHSQSTPYVTPPPSRQEERRFNPEPASPQRRPQDGLPSTPGYSPDRSAWNSPYIFQSPNSYSPWTMVPCDNTDLTESPTVIFDRSPYACVPLPDVEEGSNEPFSNSFALPTPPPSPTTLTRSRSERRRGTSANPDTNALQEPSRHVFPIGGNSTTVREAMRIVHSVASAIAPCAAESGRKKRRRM